MFCISKFGVRQIVVAADVSRILAGKAKVADGMASTQINACLMKEESFRRHGPVFGTVRIF
jgi:hypothetical protein